MTKKNDCLMFVAPWSPTTTLSIPEITTIPVWVTLKNIPNQLYSIQGISWIACGLGAPMATSKPCLDPTLMREARILVEVELNKPFPQRVAAEDIKGTISIIDVEYSWLPSKCSRCGQLGHKESRCLKHRQVVVVSPNLDTLKTPMDPETYTSITTEEVKVVPTASSEVNVVVSGDTSLETTIEEVSVPLMRAKTTFEETSNKEDHETTPIVIQTTPMIKNGINSSKITSTPEITTSSSPQLLEIGASSGNMTIPLVVESNACGIMTRDDGAIISPESSDTDMDLVASSSQRILRERHVQPTLKYNENEWIFVNTCRRSKRSRGDRRANESTFSP